jgi:predicted small secreted protein
MKKNKIVILLAAVALLLASLACNAVGGGGNDVDNTDDGDDGFSVTTANITDAHMARDVDDLDQTNVFSPTDPTFYCFFDLNNAPEGTVVKGVWTLVSAEGYDSNSEIDSAEVTGSDDYYYFSLDRSADAWPVGTYKIDLYIDGSLVETLDFEVQ